MSDYSLDFFLKIYPEFQNVPQEAVEWELESADLILSDTSWGKYRTRALYLRAAHNLGLEYDIGLSRIEAGKNQGITSGLTTGYSASNASLSKNMQMNAFATSDDPIAADFGRTTYGLKYLSLLAECMEYGKVVKSGQIINDYCNFY